MIISKLRRIVSFDQSPSFEKYFDYNFKKRPQVDSTSKKEYQKWLSNSFFGKRMEDVLNRIKIEFVKNADEKTILRYQARLDFDGIHRSYKDYDSYTFRKNGIKLEKIFVKDLLF